MSTQDFLFISLGVGFLILVGFLSYAAYHLAITLKSAREVIDNAEDITNDVRAMKNQLKGGMLTGMGTILSILSSFAKTKKGR